MQFKQTAAGVYVPKYLAKPAHRAMAVVFWHSAKLDRVVVGLPEQYPVPAVLEKLGFQKVVCRSAHEVEIWSEKLRAQERRDEERTDVEREMFEAPLVAIIRSDIRARMIASPNAITREFCRNALEQMDRRERENQLKRVSFQHSEAYEDGK